MIRLAFHIVDRVDRDRARAFRAAASQIREVELVDIDESPDAVVTNDRDAEYDGRPVLLVDRHQIHYAPWLFPAFPWRFAPAARAIRQSLDAGELGRPGLLRLHVWASASRPLGTGSRIAAADLALWLFGAEPEAVHGVGRSLRSEPCLLIHLGFPGGGMALLGLNNALHEGDGYRSISLIGSRGAAYADDHRDRNLIYRRGAPRASTPSFGRAFMRPLLEDFLARVRAGENSDKATREYRAATEVVRASGLLE